MTRVELNLLPAEGTEGALICGGCGVQAAAWAVDVDEELTGESHDLCTDCLARLLGRLVRADRERGRG